MAKNHSLGVKSVKIAWSKNWARTKTRLFLRCTGQNLFRTVEKSWKKSSHLVTAELQKKMPHFDHFPRPGESDPYENIVATKLVLRGGDFCDRPLEAEGAEAPRSHARFRLFFSLPQKLYIRIFFLNCACSGVSFVSFFWPVDYMRKLSWGRRGSAGWQLECWSSKAFEQGGESF